MSNPSNPAMVRERSAATATRMGVLFAVLAAVGFSAKAVLVKLGYREGVDAVTLLAMRMALSAPFFLAALAWRHRGGWPRFSRRDLGLVLLLGFVGYYLSSILDFLGLVYVSAGLERLILFLYPTMTVLASAFLARRPVDRITRRALAVSYLGIGLVFLHDFSFAGSEVLLGSALVFGSALAYTLYLIGAEHAIGRIGATTFTSGALLVSSAACIGQFLATRDAASILRVDARAWILSLLMAVFSTVLPVFLMSWAIARIGPGKASQIGTLGPVSTIFLAAAFLDEPVTAVQVAGAMLVVGGVYLVGRPRGRAGSGES